MTSNRLRYLGGGLAMDEETNDLHFFVENALEDFRLPDTPENREIVERAARKAVQEKWPGVLQIVEEP